jgi:hypothetical protein
VQDHLLAIGIEALADSRLKRKKEEKRGKETKHLVQQTRLTEPKVSTESIYSASERTTTALIRPLDQPRLTSVPCGDPQLRNERDLTPRSPDEMRPEREDRLVDDSVGPAGGVAVLLFEAGEGAEGAVVDAVPTESVDGGEEGVVVLLVGGDENCGEGM